MGWGEIMSDYIDVVFDGPPSHESGRFVEVENSEGKGIKFGEWIHRPDGYWALRIPREDNLPCPMCGKAMSSKHCVRCEFKESLGKDIDKAENIDLEAVPGTHNPVLMRERTTPVAKGIKNCAKALFDKLKLIEKDGRCANVFVFADNHGLCYTGPSYENELKDLEKALNESLSA